MRAVLGLEKDKMALAQASLSAAEAACAEGYNRARASTGSSTSSIYSPGTEYLLCQAQVQLMAAVMGVLSESIGGAFSSFLKLRKSYLSLEVILEEEKKYLAGLRRAEGTDEEGEEVGNGTAEKPNGDTDADEWFDVAETPGHIPSSSQAGTPAVQTAKDPAPSVADLEKALEESRLSETATLDEHERPSSSPLLRRTSTQIPDGPDADVFTTYVDSFIHSSSNMCFGMLLLMLSMMPPSLSPLIKMVGIRGDRKRGISLLWQSSKFYNLNGAFGGLVLLGYYNNFISFCDIVPKEGSGAYPRERCKLLLQSFRERYGKSCLWMLEESRMLSSEKKQDRALHLLTNMPVSKLKQVVALQYFEVSMNRMFMHRYEECSEGFVKMVGLNNWSHGLYYYIAACSRVEKYRELKDTDPESAVSFISRVHTYI
jgi:hypothetical protein